MMALRVTERGDGYDQGGARDDALTKV
jgi:hypothetical protein